MDLKVSEILNTRLEEINTTKNIEKQEDFKFTLNKIDDTNLTERLTGLVDKITEQGKKINEHMDLSDMRKYRGLISDFMEEISSNSHSYNRENFLDRRGRHRVYGIVKKVNENLDKLAEELMKSQKNNLEVMERTDEIRGLLLDIII